MAFDPSLPFADNLELFKAEIEGLDPECAKILFDNIDALLATSDAGSIRSAVQDFNQRVLVALEKLAEAQK